MTANDVASLVTDITPFVTAAVGAYGVAVLARVRDDAADATVSVGRKVLQKIFGFTTDGELPPEPLAALAADPNDTDALGTVKIAISNTLARDTSMIAEVRSILIEAMSPTVIQHVDAGRDAYVAGRDMTVNARPN
jgi:hypothetical protein